MHLDLHSIRLINRLIYRGWVGHNTDKARPKRLPPRFSQSLSRVYELQDQFENLLACLALSVFRIGECNRVATG